MGFRLFSGSSCLVGLQGSLHFMCLRRRLREYSSCVVVFVRLFRSRWCFIKVQCLGHGASIGAEWLELFDQVSRPVSCLP